MNSTRLVNKCGCGDMNIKRKKIRVGSGLIEVPVCVNCKKMVLAG